MLNGMKVSFLALGSLLASHAVVAEQVGPLSEYEPQLSDKFIQAMQAADLAAGEKTFMRKCSSCHDHEKRGGHGKGPHLWNLFGRKAGEIPGFEFSEAMKSSGHQWDFATLNYYLTNTERAVPGRTMDFRGIRRDKERARLLMFLKNFNDTPPELPDPK